MCRWWDRAIQRVFGIDASKKELCERELGGLISRSSAVRKSLRSSIWKWGGLGCGRGGGAIKRLQRCKNSRNESCVAALASEVDITSPVTLRVEPAGTRELMAQCGNCGLDTEPEEVDLSSAW